MSIVDTLYLICLGQMCFPKALFNSSLRYDEPMEKQSAKKSKTAPTDDFSINREEEALTPEMIYYLKSIASRDDEDPNEDSGIIFSILSIV